MNLKPLMTTLKQSESFHIYATDRQLKEILKALSVEISLNPGLSDHLRDYGDEFIKNGIVNEGGELND